MVLLLEQVLALYPLPLTPDGQVFTLNKLQREDVQTGITYDRVGLFLPVGYGKTVISTLIALGWGDDHVIVTVPPILVPQWVKWINSITNSGGAVGYGRDKDGKVQGPALRKSVPLRSHRFWIMSYQVFKNDLDYLTKLLADKTYTTLVDEAQGLKNISSKLFGAVFTFAAGRHLLLLTGTEMNNPSDAYAYIKLKTPLIYRSKAHFDNIHVAERDFFENPIRWQNTEDLHRNLYLQSLHRTKEEVHAHLPKANYIPWPYDLHPQHKKFYDDLAEEMLLETEAGGKIDGTTPGKLRNALQQLILSWSDFAEDPRVVALNEDKRPAFFDQLDSVMDQIDVQQRTSSKLIVWTWFKRSTKNTVDYLNAIGVPAVAAYGDSDAAKAVKAFMEDPAIRVLVAQPGSAGAGLNPQYICWETVFAEIPSRTIPFRQSAGRIDREGQKFNPNIRIMMANGTVQGKMYSDLLTNDGQVQRVQGNAFDLRKLVYS